MIEMKLKKSTVIGSFLLHLTAHASIFFAIAGVALSLSHVAEILTTDSASSLIPDFLKFVEYGVLGLNALLLASAVIVDVYKLYRGLGQEEEQK